MSRRVVKKATESCLLNIGTDSNTFILAYMNFKSLHCLKNIRKYNYILYNLCPLYLCDYHNTDCVFTNSIIR